MESKRLNLGELTLGPLLGSGGFGEVYEATVANIDVPFAVKIHSPHPAQEEEDEVLQKRFFSEASILYSLRHPGIIAIYGVGMHEGRAYILMERFDGESLDKSFQTHGKFKPDSGLRLVVRVGEALAHAHAQKVVHRDLKPSNIMVKPFAEFRVLDFGVAILLEGRSHRITRTGRSPVGNPYTAPELSDDRKRVDPRSDIYSLGAIWFRALTGTSPGARAEQALIAENVPAAHRDVLLRCLEPIEKRWNTVAELVEAAKSLADGKALKPAETPVTDEEVMLLGTVAGEQGDTSAVPTFWGIKRELSRSMAPWQLALARKALVARGFIENLEFDNDDGDTIDGLSATDEGFDWLRANHRRVKQLLPPPTPVEENEDDFPF